MYFTDKEKITTILRQGQMAIAKAKINLSIDVLGIRPEDGYHLVKMIMQQIPLHDRLFFFVGEKAGILPETTQIDDQISLACNSKRLPLDAKNLVYRAAKIILSHNNITDQISIYIDKHIPAGGGLGGGSADAAAVLSGLNQIFSLGKTMPQLHSYGKELGSDVPFMISGGAGLAEGTGTELTQLPLLKSGYLLLVNPNIFLSTELVYKTLDETKIPGESRPDTDLLLDALKNQDFYTFAKNMKNVLEIPAFKLQPEVGNLKEDILQREATGAMMSGSGATVFGLYDDAQKAKDAMAYYRSRKFFSTVTPLY